MLRIILLPPGATGGKQDLADVLAAEKTPEAQSRKLKELEGAEALDLVAFAVRLLAGVTRENWTAALKETGLWDMAAVDPDLWFARAEEIGAALKMKPREIEAWAKKTAKAALKEAEALPPEIDDPLAEFTDKKGRREPVYECIRTIIEMINQTQTRENQLWWNEMALVPMYEEREFTDHALGELRLRMATEFKCHPKHAADIRVVVENVAQCDRRHPVVEYLKGLEPWDGIDRTQILLEEVLGLELESEDQRTLYTAFARKWPIGAVARAHATPEQTEKFDNVWVLGGAQDLLKSSFWQYLCPVKTWSGSPDISAFDDSAAIKLQGLWIAEMAESNGTSYWKDIERQKAFLSKESDRVIRKYVAYAETLPRRVALCATVNEKQHGADSSGFRREWCMWLTRPVNISKLIEIRGQIWAQAFAAFKSWENLGRKREDCPWVLTDEEKRLHKIDGQRFQIADFEQDRVRAFLQGKTEVTGLEVAVGIGIDKPNSWDSRRITRHLEALGWEPLWEKKRPSPYRAPEGWTLQVIEGGAATPGVLPDVASLVAGILGDG